MKNFLLSIAIITSFAACNNTPKDDTRDIQLLSDPSAYQNKVNADTAADVAAQPLPAAEVKTAPQVITITKRIIYTPAKPANTAPVSQPAVYTPPVATQAPNPTPAGTTSDNGIMQPGSTTGGTANQPVATTTETEKKKGWSAAAKGAAIGAGAGAIGGAIISKKKGLGAIVGGVVGAAGGYIIGKDIDKKNSRLVMN
ncbi:MAG: glycine zipper domain-containing protein [Bacteroidota bacterium]|nr:glycine zipper domain-containing protein [Bacteroidota bacterium]